MCSQERCDYPTYLLRLAERELIDRERRATERRIKEAAFPVIQDHRDLRLRGPALHQRTAGAGTPAGRIHRQKGESCCWSAIPAPAKRIWPRALGFAACTQGKRVRFTTTTGLVTQLLEAREERTLQRLLQAVGAAGLLLLDELGYVPFSKSGRRVALRRGEPGLRAHQPDRNHQSAL